MKYTPREAVDAFQKSEQEAASAIQYVRTKFDFEEQSFVFDKLPEDIPNVKKFLTGGCFATNWAEVWQPPFIPTISSAQKALDWFVLICKRYAKLLNVHSRLRNDLNSAMLRGEWKIAADILEQHQQTFGPTLWAMNWAILLIEESRGAQYKIEYINQFKQGESEDIIHIFASFFGLSSDQTLPDESYRKMIQNCFSINGPTKCFFELLFLEDCFPNWKVSEILDICEFVPLIDRYELFIRLVSMGLGEKNQDALRLRRATTQIAKFSNDECLKYIVESADEERPLSSVNEASQLLRAWDAYMISDYSESLKLSSEIAIRRPDLVSAHELLVKSIIYLDKKDQITGTTPLALLWQNLCNVYLKNENSDDSLNYLQRFGRRFRVFSLTHPLRALHASHSSHFQNDNLHRRGSYAMGVHEPRNFEYGHSLDVNRNYLQRCSALFPDSLAVRFFYALSQGIAGKEVTNCDKIPQIRRYFFGGLATARHNNHSQGLAYLKHFLSLQKADSQNPLSPFAIEEARRVMVDIYRLKGDIVNMQREVVKTFLDRPQSIRRLPIQRIYKACIDNRDEACSHIEFPIIANFACDEPHEVYLELKRFLNTVPVNKPTELLKIHTFGTRSLAILFLKVCTPEVIDSLDALDSVAKVESERLQSLRWITKNIPEFARMAETEVLRLTQHVQLREALQKIEGARVVVNVAALREAEHGRFTDAYYRFAAQRELVMTRTKDEVEELVNAISALRVTGEGKVLVIRADGLIAQKETALKAFASAFQEIREAFVYSPHFGVEACLSGRIRHGIVIQHIRKPFVEKRLAVLRDSSERSEIEKYWQTRIYCYDKTQTDRVMHVLFQLTEQINSIAEEVKGVWLHSKIGSQNPEGLFDYDFSGSQLKEIYDKRMQDVTSVDIFLDRVFDVLLERTRISLRIVKDNINYELRERLRNAVDGAIAQLPDSSANFNSLALRNDLATCRQETERLCDQMGTWFQEADATLMGDASFELVARTAVGMIEQLNPEIRGRYNVNVDSIHRICGRHFTSLVHILFFMLDNANCHSNVSKELFQANVSIMTNGNELTMSVESKMRSSETAAAACKKLLDTVAELKNALDPQKVIKEGGSGYAKIIAAVRYGFKQKDPTIKATHNKECMLNVSITCDLAGLAA